MLQLFLSIDADLRQAQMPRIAFEEIGVVPGRDRQSRHLPGLETSGHRSKPRIAFVLQSPGREHGALAAAADQEDIDVRAGDRLCGVALQLGTWSEYRISGNSERVFVGFAHVDQNGALLLSRVRLLRSDFGNR